MREVLIMKQLNGVIKSSSDQKFLSAKRQMMTHIQERNDKYQNVNLKPVKPSVK